MSDLVAVNESTDATVIELAEEEVGDSSCQFEVGEKFASFEAFQLKLKRHKNVRSFYRVLEERFENHMWGKEKGELRGPLNQS